MIEPSQNELRQSELGLRLRLTKSTVGRLVDNPVDPWPPMLALPVGYFPCVKLTATAKPIFEATAA